MSRVPTQLENRRHAGILTVRWPDGDVDELPHALLRAACPCSGCRAVRRAGGTIDPSSRLRLAAIEPVGMYGLNLLFDDGHERGIYPFALLAELARHAAPPA